jgi:hypothetical protein
VLIGIVCPFASYSYMKGGENFDRDIDIVGYGLLWYLKLLLLLCLPLTIAFISNWSIADYAGNKNNKLGNRILFFFIWILLNAIAVLMIFYVFKIIISSL